MKKNSFNKQLDIKSIRSHFPIFDKNKIVYLDTAASAQKPYKVIKCIEDLYKPIVPGKIPPISGTAGTFVSSDGKNLFS